MTDEGIADVRRPPSSEAKGVYLMANDVAYDWIVAALAALRRSNPFLPIIVIPFDERVTRLERLLRDSGVTFWSDLELLTELDGIGRRFSPRNHIGASMFRKLAVFAGPLQTFAYVDSDVLVKRPIDDLLEQASRRSREILFLDSEARSTIISDSSSFIGDMENGWFNAGFFAAQRDEFSLSEIFDMAEKLQPYSEDMVTVEQSFLNLLVMLSGRQSVQACDAIRSYPAVTFARRVAEDFPEEASSWPVLHWAGESLSPQMSLRRIFVRERLRDASVPDCIRFLVWTSWVRPALQSSRHIRRIWYRFGQRLDLRRFL